jgi:hypothetical protein
MAGERELVAHFLTHLHGYTFLNRADRAVRWRRDPA